MEERCHLFDEKVLPLRREGKGVWFEGLLSHADARERVPPAAKMAACGRVKAVGFGRFRVG